MKLRLFFTVATALATVSIPLVPALAEPDFSADYPGLSQEFCEKTSTTPYLIRCAYQQAKTSDQRLNEIYQKAKSSLSTVGQKQLISTQLTWIKYRDKTCEPLLATDANGHRVYGRESTIQYWSCLARLTRQRTAELDQILEND